MSQSRWPWLGLCALFVATAPHAVAQETAIAPFREATPPTAPRDLARESDDPLFALDRQAAAHAEALRVGRARRDSLLQRIERYRRARSWTGRLGAWWEARKARAELRQLVEELQGHQARLHQLRAAGDSILARPAELEWKELEALASEASRAWLEGRDEDPALSARVARALDRVGAAERGVTFERYRLLVRRLARLNTLIAGREAALAGQDDGGNHAAEGERLRTESFLDVAERGPKLDPTESAPLDMWISLRDDLAKEIVATASEITRRARLTS